MHYYFDNVNDAFYVMVSKFYESPILVSKDSRNGKVRMIEEPVLITYKHPCQRVLFNKARDCNPFFHVYEALWMLAGRNDLEPLTMFIPSFGKFSDDGETLNGAYGFRWRHAQIPGVTEELYRQYVHKPGYQMRDHDHHAYSGSMNQLDVLIDHLIRNPDSRRAVLQMWNTTDDLMKIDESKDVCCNTSVMFSLRDEKTSELRPERFKRIGPEWQNDLEGRKQAEDLSESLYGTREHVRFRTDSQEWFVFNPSVTVRYLDMTVTNRSNDLVWGLFGANAVHFSFLQEYMALRLGVKVGRFHTMTNNLHAYDWNWEPQKWLSAYDGQPIQPYDYDKVFLRGVTESVPINYVPLFYHNDHEEFQKELEAFVKLRNEGEIRLARESGIRWETPFIRRVAMPMLLAWWCHKVRNYEQCRVYLADIEQVDWREVCIQWINQREEQWKSKQKEEQNA